MYDLQALSITEWHDEARRRVYRLRFLDRSSMIHVELPFEHSIFTIFSSMSSHYGPAYLSTVYAEGLL